MAFDFGKIATGKDTQKGKTGRFDFGDIESRITPRKNQYELERREGLYNAQGVSELASSLNEKEAPAKGFTSLGLFSSPQQSYRDVFKRGGQDEEYRKKIQSNSKTIAELLKKKRENPEKAVDYDIMVKALMDKNKLLTEASGGKLKDKTGLQLFGQALSTAADLTPVGAGITSAGRQVLTQGAKKVVGSLAKEGAAFGVFSGAGSVAQKDKEELTPSGVFGEMISSILTGTVTNVAIGTAFNKIGEKVSKWLRGDKVEFTPKEKTFLAENAPEMTDEKIFEEAGITPPLKKTDGDLLSKTIAETEDEEVIKKLITGKVPDEDIPTLAKTLRNTTDEDTVASILGGYDPVKKRDELAIKIAATDNEKKIATLLKGQVADADIPVASRILRGVEDETEISKILDEFKINASNIQEKQKLSFPDDSAKTKNPLVKRLEELENIEKEKRKAIDKENADALRKAKYEYGALKEQEQFSGTFFDAEKDFQYQDFKGLLRRYNRGKIAEIIRNSDYKSISESLEKKGFSKKELGRMFYSQSESEDEVLDSFREMFEKEMDKVKFNKPEKKPYQKEPEELISLREQVRKLDEENNLAMNDINFNEKAPSNAPKEGTGTTTPKAVEDDGEEAFLKSVEERFKESKRNKFREATKDDKGRFTGSKSEARMKTGDPERDALSESIQTRIDNLGNDDLNKTTQSNFDDTSQRLKLEDIQSQIPKAKVEELPRLKEESDRIIKEILDKRAREFKATSKKEDLVQKAQEIARNSNTSLEFRINLRKEGLGKAFKSQQAAEEFYRRMNGSKYRLADEDPLIQEARKYKSEEEFVKAQGTRTGVEVRDKIGTKLQDPYTAEYLPTNSDGTITLYHSTTKEGAEKIKQSGIFGSKTEGGDIYFTTNKKGYGGIGKDKDVVLAFNVDPNKIKFDDVYRGELHLKGNNTDIGGIKPVEIKTKSQLTDIWKKAHGEKFRDIAPRFEELTGTKITPEQEAQIKSLHKRMFGDENVEITAQILTPEGQKAFGVYKNNVIKILDGQADPTDTLYHESVHKYLDLFTTVDEQKKIYLEARKLWKTDNLDDLEEKIAEDFIRYAKTNEGVVGTMKILFDKVIDRIKTALKGESSIEALYKNILEGKAATRTSQKPNKSGLVKTLQKNAEARGVTLEKKDVPRLASKMSMDDETKKAFTFYAKDPDTARAMAMRGEAPDGIRPGALYNAVRDTAIIENDIDTLYSLRSSKEAIEAAAEAGREVKAYDSTLRSDPVKIMREIDDLKIKIAERSGVDAKAEVKTILKELKEAVEKSSSGDEGFAKLLNAIRC